MRGNRNAKPPCVGKDVPQCKAKARSGKRCRMAARKGFDVCMMHGAGTEKRVREGTRKDPRTAPVTTGEHAKPETLALYSEMHPDHAARVREYLRDKEKLRDFDRLLAHLWATLDLVSERRPDVAVGENGGEHPPALVAVLQAIGQNLERVARIEGKIQQGPVINLAVLVNGVVEVLGKHVPGEKFDAALAEVAEVARRAVPGSGTDLQGPAISG